MKNIESLLIQRILSASWYSEYWEPPDTANIESLLMRIFLTIPVLSVDNICVHYSVNPGYTTTTSLNYSLWLQVPALWYSFRCVIQTELYYIISNSTFWCQAGDAGQYYSLPGILFTILVMYSLVHISERKTSIINQFTFIILYNQAVLPTQMEEYHRFR